MTTKVAAEALGVDPRTIRTYIRRGELEAKSEGEGVEKAYLVAIDSVYALRDTRKSSGKVREASRAKSARSEGAEDLADLVRDLTAQLVGASTDAADLRARLELTAHAESSIRGERDRLLADLERERERVAALEAELEALRGAPEAPPDAPSGARGSPETAAEGPGEAWGTSQREAAERPVTEEEPRRRSWWREFFGF